MFYQNVWKLYSIQFGQGSGFYMLRLDGAYYYVFDDFPILYNDGAIGMFNCR
ncbi:hypothetical protein H7T43_10715 [Peribacillus simplex]|uniref:hypothetical protein n=1 Tax=Peribacillus simplex TaxID=1478 RepID=UPI002989A098|nr:hypothetical protein [Peribacillus simplex]MBX9955384.1 hypothetical protein [Peribacillus simplex]